MPSFGGHSLFPRPQRDELLTGLGAATDGAGGSFTNQFTAAVVTAARMRPREG